MRKADFEEVRFYLNLLPVEKVNLYALARGWLYDFFFIWRLQKYIDMYMCSRRINI